MIRHCGDARAALAALPDLARRGGATRVARVGSRQDAEREFAAANSMGVTLVATAEAEYPHRLRMIDDAPPLLAVRGTAAALALPTVAIVGAEEIHPVIGKLTRLAQPLGLPYIPVTPTFPWLGPLGLLPIPTKWTIQFGPAIASPPLPVDHEERDALVAKETERVKRTIDGMLVRIIVERRSVLFG